MASDIKIGDGSKCFYTIFFYVLRLHATDPEFTTIKSGTVSSTLWRGLLEDRKWGHSASNTASELVSISTKGATMCE